MTTGGTNGPRVALVLGSGGVLGGSYHAGVLKALYDTWGVDARSVDLIVGTSAGSLAGALVAAGLHPNDLFRRETGQRLSPSGAAVLARGRARRGPRPVPRTAIGAPAAPQAVLAGLTRPWRVSSGSVAAALLPRGVIPTDHLAATVDGILGPGWPGDPGNEGETTGGADGRSNRTDRPRLRIVAVELATARRVVFGSIDDVDDLDGRADRVATIPSRAIAASCAVPAVFAPVPIDGRDFHDGGVHSADNADLVGTSPYDLVVVSSPMAADRPLSGGLTLMGLRQVSRFQTAREVRGLRRVGHVEILRPTVADLDAMGSNLLDPRRRAAVAYQAHTSASAQLGRRPSPIESARPSRPSRPAPESSRSTRTTPSRSRSMAI